MDLHFIQTTQQKMKSNDRAPVIAEDSWRIPESGQTSRSDWLRFHALLVGSRSSDADFFDPDQIFASAGEISDLDFEKKLEELVLRPALNSMWVTYSRPFSTPQQAKTAGWVRQFMCRGQAEDLANVKVEVSPTSKEALAGIGSRITYKLQLKPIPADAAQLYYPFGDDWFYRSNLRTEKPANPPPNPWYDPNKDIISVRTLVEVRIALQTAPGATSEPAAPCLSVADFQSRTGSQVIAIRRMAKFAVFEGDPIGSRPAGSDGRVAIAFKSIRSLHGASGYFKADPAFKTDMLLAHGDILILKRPPSRAGYRLD